MYLYSIPQPALQPITTVAVGSPFVRMHGGDDRNVHVKLERRLGDKVTFFLVFGTKLRIAAIDDAAQAAELAQPIPEGRWQLETGAFGSRVNDLRVGCLAITEDGPFAGVMMEGAGYLEETCVSLATWSFGSFGNYVGKAFDASGAKLVWQPDHRNANPVDVWTF